MANGHFLNQLLRASTILRYWSPCRRETRETLARASFLIILGTTLFRSVRVALLVWHHSTISVPIFLQKPLSCTWKSKQSTESTSTWRLDCEQGSLQDLDEHITQGQQQKTRWNCKWTITDWPPFPLEPQVNKCFFVLLIYRIEHKVCIVGRRNSIIFICRCILISWQLISISVLTASSLNKFVGQQCHLTCHIWQEA